LLAPAANLRCLSMQTTGGVSVKPGSNATDRFTSLSTTSNRLRKASRGYNVSMPRMRSRDKRPHGSRGKRCQVDVEFWIRPDMLMRDYMGEGRRASWNGKTWTGRTNNDYIAGVRRACSLDYGYFRAVTVKADKNVQTDRKSLPFYP